MKAVVLTKIQGLLVIDQQLLCTRAEISQENCSLLCSTISDRAHQTFRTWRTGTVRNDQHLPHHHARLRHASLPRPLVALRPSRPTDARHRYLATPLAFDSTGVSCNTGNSRATRARRFNPPILGESGEEGSFAEPTVDKAFSVDGLIPPSAEFSGLTKLHEAYVNYREAIDLSNIRCAASLMRRIMAVLENHVGIYTGALGTIKVTEYLIDLHPETKTIHQQAYLAGLKSGQILEQHIQTQLDAGIIEPAQT